MMRKDLDAELPSHVEQTVQTIAALHGQHQRQTSRAHRFVHATTRLVGSPIFAGAFTVLLTLWVVINLYQLFVGHLPLDPPPFPWVQTITSVLGFYVMVLILITQRHENRLEETRAQLTLQVAMLAERKNAKIIELLEQLRRDHPNIADRVDEDATAMSQPTDAEAVIEAINSSQATEPVTNSL
jgi:uncharacterized membrane protein